MLTRLFQLLLDSSTVPLSWKHSIIRPVPKKPGASSPNDFRPIALTSVLCKTMERVLVNPLTTSVSTVMDPFQFAYKRNRGTDDALLTMLNAVTQHLMHPKGYARILFIDFSSAFNSMKIHILLKRAADLKVHPSLI